jgi:hypothetical protein
MSINGKSYYGLFIFLFLLIISFFVTLLDSIILLIPPVIYLLIICWNILFPEYKIGYIAIVRSVCKIE